MIFIVGIVFDGEQDFVLYIHRWQRQLLVYVIKGECGKFKKKIFEFMNIIYCFKNSYILLNIIIVERRES